MGVGLRTGLQWRSGGFSYGFSLGLSKGAFYTLEGNLGVDLGIGLGLESGKNLGCVRDEFYVQARVSLIQSFAIAGYLEMIQEQVQIFFI